MATPSVTFYQEGDYPDYTPGSAVTAGDVVVQNELVGIATKDIAANAKGALRITGVAKFPKTSGSGEAIAAGRLVYWDSGNDVMTETAGANTKAGITVEAAADADTTVKVCLIPGKAA